jgi:hypothetical protein
MVRTMAVDWESPKRERKEYLSYVCSWEAMKRLDNSIRFNSHTEGKFTQQTKYIKTKYNPDIKEEEAYSERCTKGSL